MNKRTVFSTFSLKEKKYIKLTPITDAIIYHEAGNVDEKINPLSKSNIPNRIPLSK